MTLAERNRFSLVLLLGFMTYVGLALGLLAQPIVRPFVEILYVLLLFAAVVVAVSGRKLAPFDLKKHTLRRSLAVVVPRAQ